MTDKLTAPEMRRRLPNRRQGINRTLEWKGQTFDICIGFDHAGEAREVFVNDAGKTGSDVKAILDDAAVLISLCLQSGIDAVALYKSLGRESHTATGEPSDDPSSLLGEIVATVINTEMHCGKQMRDGYRAARRLDFQPPPPEQPAGLYRGLNPNR